MRTPANKLFDATGHFRTGLQSKSTLRCLAVVMMLCIPALALAQTSPFATGATALQSNILTWLTPVAVILVMVLGGMAMANRISWGWCIAAILGIAISFGAPQIVTWVRGMFGV
jgi:type IV secretion system protein VirB2